MKYLVTAEEMRKYDNNTIERLGIPAMVLMERAALALREEIHRWMETNSCMDAKVFILAGVGNNGGDGLALARLLAEEKIPVTVCCVGNREKASVEWLRQWEILQHYPVEISSNLPEKEYNILVDGLFGVGLSREVSGEYKEAIDVFNAMNGYKIAIDIPSGLNADNGSVMGCVAEADTTVTFAFCKRGLMRYPGCEKTGKVIVADIGITEFSFPGEEPGMFLIDEPVNTLLPVRSACGNKGTFGKVLLVAGSNNMAGAAVLAAKAAYRSGAGMVKVITPEENRVIIQETLPEALLGTSAEAMEQSLDWADVVVMGPGMGTGNFGRECLEMALSCEKTLVLDADTLNLISKDEELRFGLKHRESATILTPHIGELARLTGESVERLKKEPEKYGTKLAKETGTIVVAKDARTYVCDGKHPICMNVRGNSGMATAGSGDVLAGIIGALAAQGTDAYKAACVGVYLHAIAGDKAAAELGEHALMAGDIIERIGRYDG